MKVGTLLRIIDDALPVLVKHGIINDNDDFVEVPAEKWAVVAAEIIQIIEQRGVDIDDRIVRVVNALPMILGLF